MRQRGSEAWMDLGYMGPNVAQLNVEVQVARSQERREFRQKLEAHDAVPMRRVDARQAFARMHAVVEGGGEV